MNSSMPNPLVPWEIYGNVHPAQLRCVQGEEEGWVTYIWYPYWGTRSEDQQELIKNFAPSQEWVEWLVYRDRLIPETKEFFRKNGLKFDYCVYLEMFKMKYISARSDNSV